MNKVTVRNKIFEVDGKTINGNDIIADMVKTGDRFYHVIYNDKSYRVELVKLEKSTKTATLKVNNSVFEVNVKDKFDQLLEQMMTKNPVSISPHATLKEAVDLMENRPSQLSVLPVVLDEICVGLIRIHDIYQG